MKSRYVCFTGPRLIYILHFFVFTLGVTAVATVQASADAKPVGKIITVTGTVKFLASSETPVAQAKPGEASPATFERWEKVKRDQIVYEKDQFQTFRKSRVKILFEDKSLIALGPNSKFKVESYVFDAKDKLRQGIMSLSHGLSMYIVNKSQKNKNSYFRIVTPTANVAARGTHGFVSATDEMTFVANQAGAVETENVETACQKLELPGKLCGGGEEKYEH
jgi:hypothetical protein